MTSRFSAGLRASCDVIVADARRKVRELSISQNNVSYLRKTSDVVRSVGRSVIFPCNVAKKHVWKEGRTRGQLTPYDVIVITLIRRLLCLHLIWGNISVDRLTTTIKLMSLFGLNNLRHNKEKEMFAIFRNRLNRN